MIIIKNYTNFKFVLFLYNYFNSNIPLFYILKKQSYVHILIVHFRLITMTFYEPHKNDDIKNLRLYLLVVTEKCNLIHIILHYF